MKKFFITTSIAYTNADPHIGHALEFIQADVIARYRRKLGDSVFFTTGTDEHGAKIARRAEELAKKPRELVDEKAELFRALKENLNLSWDVFIRTSDEKRHWPTVQKLWNALYANGDLYRKVYEGMYCVGHEAFITEKDLKNGVCEIHKKPPETLREENWFFRLSKYTKKIKKTLEKNTVVIIPESRKHEALSFIREGLQDVSFSRPAKDLSWGIPVPNDKTQTVYVWTDALANYLSVAGFGSKNNQFKKWWPPDTQVIGRDILRFHSLIWLGILMALKLKLPKKLFVHGFITINGEKMSKSLGNVLNPSSLVSLCGIDALRYFLLREIPATDDGDVSFEKLKARYNGDLANGLGNLVSRVAALGEKISPLPYSLRVVASQTKKEFKKRKSAHCRHMDNFHFNEALGEIWQMIGFSDRYVNVEKPWAIADTKKLLPIIADAAFLIMGIAELLEPFLPETSDKIQKQFMLKKNKLIIKKGVALFPRLP